MNKPPPEIEGANVLYWTWSGDTPFGIVHGSPEEIYGLAICRYSNSNQVYRLSCNKNWETEQDGLFDSVEQAIENLLDQYRKLNLFGLNLSKKRLKNASFRDTSRGNISYFGFMKQVCGLIICWALRG